MRNVLKFTIIIILTFGISSSILASKTELKIPIKIDNPASLDKPWPITCGVPFPQGNLKNISRLKVIDSKGNTVPCQIDVTATWLQDKSIRWILLNFLGNPKRRYFLISSDAKIQHPEKLKITQNTAGINIDTGMAKFKIPTESALPDTVKFNKKALLQSSGNGAYLIDNKGNKAFLGGAKSEMKSHFLLRGNFAAVLRKEGWYVTKKGERFARGIVWLYFYGNCPYVKIVHKLVLTKNTNKVWFKDIGIDFNFSAEAKNADFAIENKLTSKTKTVALNNKKSIWILQDNFPHFMSRDSHFTLSEETGSGKQELLSGKACGDWININFQKIGLTLVLRDFPEQFPKEFSVQKDKATVHLWSAKSGKELDFKTSTLIKEYWGEWANYSNITIEQLKQIPSDAQSSAKTHTLWLLPHVKEPLKDIAKVADSAAERILSIPDPKWVCDSNAIGPPMLQKDVKNFPREEAFISDFFDRLMIFPNKFFPMAGYINWGANPCTRYSKDSKTGKMYGVWWRISGIIDYYIRRNIWHLYARSGDRKYFKSGAKFNRFIGDMNMHHWDNNGKLKKLNKKVKGGFGCAVYPRDFQESVYKVTPAGKKILWKSIASYSNGGDPSSLPIYWRSMSSHPGGSGAGISNNLYHFYFSGDWDVRELVENYGNAVKNNEWLQIKKVGRGTLVYMRNFLNAYSLDWDEKLGELTRNLARKTIDLSSPNAISMKSSPHAMYKIGRNSIAMLDYYRLTGDELGKKGFIKMVDYDFRFGGIKPCNPIGYQDAKGMMFTMLSRFTGDDKYFYRAYQTINAGIKAEEDFKTSCKKRNVPPYKGQCFNYQACLNMPVILKYLSTYKGHINSLPMLIKNNDSTSNAWAVFKKQADKAVIFDLLYNLSDAQEVKPVITDPDMKPYHDYIILKKEKRMLNPFVKGDIPIYVKLKIPTNAPAGTYRLGQENPGAFTVINCNVKKMSLECPEGFWLQAYAPFYFKVPKGMKTVKIFVQLPVNISRPDGSKALSMTEFGKSGIMELPVKGKYGFWKIEYTHPAFVKLLNLPPIVSCMTSDKFFIPEKMVKLDNKRPQFLPPNKTFVKGVIKSAIQMTAKNGLKFKRGKKLKDGSYKNFPVLKGTIEFYYRPNWTATEQYLRRRGELCWPLLSAGPIGIRYRYGQTYHNYAYFEILCGKTKFKARGRVGTPFGNNARYFPKAGEWVHIAVTWDVTDTTRKYNKSKYNQASEHFEIFLNGKKCRRIFSTPGRLKLYIGESFAKNFDISGIPEWITVGPGNGTYDELRISDIVRYNKDFTLPKKAFKTDKNTKVLMHFDDSINAKGASSNTIETSFDNSSNGSKISTGGIEVSFVNKNRKKQSPPNSTLKVNNNGNVVVAEFSNPKAWKLRGRGKSNPKISFDSKTPDGKAAITLETQGPGEAVVSTGLIKAGGNWRKKEYKQVSFMIKNNGDKGLAFLRFFVPKGNFSVLVRFPEKDKGWQRMTIKFREDITKKHKVNEIILCRIRTFDKTNISLGPITLIPAK